MKALNSYNELQTCEAAITRWPPTIVVSRVITPGIAFSISKWVTILLVGAPFHSIYNYRFGAQKSLVMTRYDQTVGWVLVDN